MITNTYKKNKPFNERVQESNRILSKYAKYIPVYVHKYKNVDDDI